MIAEIFDSCLSASWKSHSFCSLRTVIRYLSSPTPRKTNEVPVVGELLRTEAYGFTFSLFWEDITLALAVFNWRIRLAIPHCLPSFWTLRLSRPSPPFDCVDAAFEFQRLMSPAFAAEFCLPPNPIAFSSLATVNALWVGRFVYVHVGHAFVSQHRVSAYCLEGGWCAFWQTHRPFHVLPTPSDVLVLDGSWCLRMRCFTAHEGKTYGCHKRLMSCDRPRHICLPTLTPRKAWNAGAKKTSKDGGTGENSFIAISFPLSPQTPLTPFSALLRLCVFGGPNSVEFVRSAVSAHPQKTTTTVTRGGGFSRRYSSSLSRFGLWC